MGGWPVDVECEAAFLLRPFSSPPSAAAAIRYWMKAEILAVRGLVVPARFRKIEGAPVVEFRAGMPPKKRRFWLFHELSEWHLARLKVQSDQVELIANALAAALVAPWPSFRSRARRIGPAFQQLALEFAITETCAALRYGEVTDTPVVVDTGGEPLVRGRPWRWGREELRGLAKAPPPPGVARVELDGTDGAGNVGWIADGSGADE